MSNCDTIEEDTPFGPFHRSFISLFDVPGEEAPSSINYPLKKIKIDLQTNIDSEDNSPIVNLFNPERLNKDIENILSSEFN